MAKRRSEEARVLAYFRQQPMEKVELMLGLVKEEVKQRTAQEREVPYTRKPAKKRKKALVPSAQTSFDIEAMAQ